MFVIAIVLLLTGLAFHQVTTLVDLFPFNNVRQATRRERAAEASINGAVMLVPVALLLLAAAAGVPLLATAAGVVELLVAVAGLTLWWLPYLADRTVPWATAGTDENWAQLHARTYAKTVIVLPRIGDRPRPNLEHMVLHSILLAAAACCFAYSASR